jgi:hypothetical protein
MSFVETGKGLGYWECDQCSARHDLAWDFMSEWSALKAEGWRARKGEDGWLHRCPECAAAAAAEREKRLGPLLDRKLKAV